MAGLAERPRKFAPLKPDAAGAGDEARMPRLKGVVFDVDGTLCEFLGLLQYIGFLVILPFEGPFVSHRRFLSRT